jgi:hypothetical protein
MKKINVQKTMLTVIILTLVFCQLSCSKPGVYHDPVMDFSMINRVAIMPLANYTNDQMSIDRVRDVLATRLQATGAFYVMPMGEVMRGVSRAQIRNPEAPNAEETQKIGKIIEVDALITGGLREYGSLRSGSVSSNNISLSLQMIETETGKVIWSGTATYGGITWTDRLFGSGGQPMNDVTVEAIDSLINQLFD